MSILITRIFQDKVRGATYVNFLVFTLQYLSIFVNNNLVGLLPQKLILNTFEFPNKGGSFLIMSLNHVLAILLLVFLTFKFKIRRVANEKLDSILFDLD